ncbi:MAG: hypothetical protein IT303_18955 [Dehalococcoidia bacterium]|nr:hypothetical protein [Dehalococcoidia bacterium]
MNLRKYVALAAATAALAVAAVLPTAASAEVPSSEVPAALKNAIKANVEARGKAYLGFCRDVPASGDHAGKWCVFVQEISGNTATVTMGPWATNDITTVTFTNSSGTWSAPGPATPTPPADGVPAALKAAIRANVEARGVVYLGLCADVVPGPDVFGKWCAGIQELTATSAIVNIAPYATDQFTRVRFTLSGGTWTWAIIGEPPREPGAPGIPKPPATGGGQAVDGGDEIEGTPIALATIVAVGALGALWVVRGRAR